MKKKFFQLLLFTLILMMASTVFAAKASPEQQRAELNEMSGKVLERMYQKYPSAQEAVQNAYAYCTISASSIKWGFYGDDHGRGVAVNNHTDERIYVKMKEVSLGINFGAKEYDLLFIIANKKAWDRFISGNIKFGSEASADATDGVNGVTYAGAAIAAEGVQVYQLDKKGLAIEATFKGGRISPYRTLN
jgi:lipid-binding SYLF domain-containing protein